MKTEIDNHKKDSLTETSLPNFKSPSEEGWGRRIVSNSNNNAADKELSAIWENAKSAKVSNVDTNIFKSVGLTCQIKSKASANVDTLNWMILSKRVALEKIASLIASFGQDSVRSKEAFITGKITTLKFNEDKKSVEILFEVHLPCP